MKEELKIILRKLNHTFTESYEIWWVGLFFPRDQLVFTTIALVLHFVWVRIMNFTLSPVFLGLGLVLIGLAVLHTMVFDISGLINHIPFIMMRLVLVLVKVIINKLRLVHYCPDKSRIKLEKSNLFVLLCTRPLWFRLLIFWWCIMLILLFSRLYMFIFTIYERDHASSYWASISCDIS
jgi:hypothetical protein